MKKVQGLRLAWQFYVWVVLMLGLPILAFGFQATSPITLEDGSITITDPLPVDNGGTERQTLTLYNVLLGAGTGPIDYAAPGANPQALISNGAAFNPTFQALDLAGTSAVTGLLPLANGGTNKNVTPLNGALLYTDADSAEVMASVGTSGQCLKSQGAANPPTFGTCTTSGSPLVAFSTVGNVSNSTVYVNFAGGVDTTEVRVQMPMPAATFANLRCVSSVAPGGTQTIIITGRYGACGGQGPDADHTCTITGAATTCDPDPDTDPVVVTAGQCLDYSIASSATAANAVVNCTVERTA